MRQDGTPPPRPRWVKLLVGLIALAVVAVVVSMLIAGGAHGPGRHLPGGNDQGQHTPPVEHRP